jgi:hypothetical protein
VGGVGPRTYVVRTTARLRLHRLCLNVASSSTVDRSIVPLPGRIISSARGLSWYYTICFSPCYLVAAVDFQIFRGRSLAFYLWH